MHEPKSNKILKWELRDIIFKPQKGIYHSLVSVTDGMVVGYVEANFCNNPPFQWSYFVRKPIPMFIDGKQCMEVSKNQSGYSSTLEEAKFALTQVIEKCEYTIVSEDLEAFV
jgi:hypothetical protein